MIKFKNVMLLTIIGIVVLLSGCLGNQEKSSYQVQVTEVKILQDCIVLGETKPCVLVNLNVKNNNVTSLYFQIVREELVSSKSGKHLGIKYDRDIGLSNLCVRQSGMAFILDANTDKNVAMCYPIVHKSDNPTLNVGAMVNNERKEYVFDLTKYGLTD